MYPRDGELRERTLRWLERSLIGWDYVAGAPPPGGWLRVTRVALGMSMRQMATRLWVTKTAVASAESGEASGAISLGTLRGYAGALECKVVYVLVPAAGSLRETLEHRLEGWYRAQCEAKGKTPDDAELAAYYRTLGSRNLSTLWDGKMGG